MSNPTNLHQVPLHERPTDPPSSDRPTFVDTVIGYTPSEALTFILARVERLQGDPCRDEQFRAIVKAFRGRLLRIQGSGAPLTSANLLHYTEPFLARVNQLLESMTVPFSPNVRQTCKEIELQVRTLKPSR